MRREKPRNGLLPNSLRVISSCLKTVSSNAGSVASTVRSAGATVAASISLPGEEEKDQVLWVGFDKIQISSTCFRHALLLGYANGFQVLDVEDASNIHELVSKRAGPVTFLQVLPVPARSEGTEGFRASHPLLLVVACEGANGSNMAQGSHLSALVRETSNASQQVDSISTPTVVLFFSLRSHSYVHVLRFRSAVYIVRCSPRVVAVALAAQIYCFDAVTLENKFSVLTYPMQGPVGTNVGLGPIAVGPRWLAYASNNPILSNSGRLSPQNLTTSPGVSPSTSPSSGGLVARYAVESSKQLAAGIINLGDMGYKTLSKYYQDLLPDGSNSPTSSSFGRKTGRLGSATQLNEVDNAGMVVIKDFVSKEVISQFRAHTSPISALCFDPSGTLLVTASVHGNNINVFRIMPNCVPNGTSSSCYDWATSHVHLYKLYRGITTAVIQDICFSHYSQWIAVVSSHGTCHIYVLSPFGGSAVLQTQTSHSDGPSLVPTLSRPWWSTSTSTKDHQVLPPPPVALSVVSRIKDGNSGWLNTVSSIAASAAGKAPTPSGAVAAVFHRSVDHDSRSANSKAKALEHLLVYSPSGHLVQHELLPSSVAEACDSNSKLGSGPLLQAQDEELRVNAVPVQWWDVCRRLNWPERKECISSARCDGQEHEETLVDVTDCEDTGSKNSSSSPSSTACKDFVRTHEKSHWYFSNAEVLVSSVRLPIWQKSKIRFYSMDRQSSEIFTCDYHGGEIEIENISVDEVETKRKDLLPVFGHRRERENGLHPELPWRGTLQSGLAHVGDGLCFQASGLNRGLSGIIHLTGSATEAVELREKSIGNGITEHPGIEFVECSKAESQRTEGIGSVFKDASSARPCDISIPEPMESSTPCVSALSTIMVVARTDKMEEGESPEGTTASAPFEVHSSGTLLSHVDGSPTMVDHSSDDSLSNRAPSISDPTIHPGSSEPSHFPGYIRDGYCEALKLDLCNGSAEAAPDGDSSSSHCDQERPEEDVDNDDTLLGGVFSFSEEGENSND